MYVSALLTAFDRVGIQGCFVRIQQRIFGSETFHATVSFLWVAESSPCLAGLFPSKVFGKSPARVDEESARNGGVTGDRYSTQGLKEY